MKTFVTKYSFDVTPWLIIELSNLIGYISIRIARRQIEITFWNKETSDWDLPF